MIILPGQIRFGIKAGSNPVVTTVGSFIELSKSKDYKKKDLYRVELTGPILSIGDLFSGRLLDVNPKKKEFRAVAGKSNLKVKDFKNKDEKEEDVKSKG